MQTLYDLSPAGLTQVLNEKHGKILQNKETISHIDFLKITSKHFIDSVITLLASIFSNSI